MNTTSATTSPKTIVGRIIDPIAQVYSRMTQKGSSRAAQVTAFIRDNGLPTTGASVQKALLATAPPMPPANHQAVIPVPAATARPSAPVPQPASPAAAVALPVASAQVESKYLPPRFSAETLELLALACRKPDRFDKSRAGLKASAAADASRTEAVSKLAAMGINMDDTGCRAIVYRDQFNAMPHSLRGEMMASGFINLRERPKNATPAEYSEAEELRFPVQPPPGRSWRTFWNLGPAAIEKINKDAAKPESGWDLRQELTDAYCSMFPSSWRFHNDPPPERNPDPSAPVEERIDMRERFYNKFKQALQACNDHGPNEETPNDPAPPVLSNAMLATEFLALPEAVVVPIINKMSRERHGGRNQRAELKRAYREGSPAVKYALYCRYRLALTAFPKEFV